MRRCLSLLSVLGLLIGAAFLGPRASAQTKTASALLLSKSSILAGQLETITVVARDLAGKPLTGATGVADVHYPLRTFHYHLKATDAHGATSVSFHARGNMGSGPVVVIATLSRGPLHVQVAGRFLVGSAATATATSVATATPTATATSAATLQLVARAVPPVVTAPQPEYVVVFVHNADGSNLANAPVDASAVFAGGTAQTSGMTDASGSAVLELNTAAMTAAQVVQVGVTVRSGADVATASVPFTVQEAPPTPTPTDIPTATPVPTPTSTPTPIPTLPPTPTPTPIPTSTPFPTDTPVPTATSTPTPTATPVPQCPGSQQGCMQYVLDLINQSRAQYSQQYGLGLAPLSLNLTQSNGTASCVGSVGHSQAMANSGSIWHQDPNYPTGQGPATFPNNICVSTGNAGENVGRENSGDEKQDIDVIHQLMMSEQDDPSTCAQAVDHACNIVAGKFHQVGIGLVEQDGYTYLTEDFLG